MNMYNMRSYSYSAAKVSKIILGVKTFAGLRRRKLTNYLVKHDWTWKLSTSLEPHTALIYIFLFYILEFDSSSFKWTNSDNS